MKSLSYGILPNPTEIDFPEGGYEIEARGMDWDQITKAVNQGIDSHLEAIFFDQFAGDYGKNGIRIKDAKSLCVLVRRLTEQESDNADSLASGIMETVGIEWI